MKPKPCRWRCGRTTDRRCGICLACCDARDERNKRIDQELEPYVPPQDRPGHRLYERKQGERTDKQRASITKLNQSKPTILAKERPSGATQAES